MTILEIKEKLKEKLMADKKVFITIGLTVVLLVSIVMNFHGCSIKKALMLERDNVKNENSILNKKIEETIKDKKSLEEKFNTLKVDLDKLTKEKDSLVTQKDQLQKQYNVLVKEKAALQEQLKEQPKAAREEKAVVVTSPSEDAYWAGVLKSKNDLIMKLEDVRRELNKLKIDNEKLQRDKAALELDIETITRDKQNVGQSVGEQMKSLDAISVELVREKNARIKIEDELSIIKKENTELKRQLKRLNARKSSLETKLQKLQEDKSALQRQFNEMGALLENKVSQMGDVKQKFEDIRSGTSESETTESPGKESIELPPIVVRPPSENPISAEGRSPSLATGIAKVMEVNRENKFVIIDLGDEYGLKIGDTFQVYRSGKLVGTIEVAEVRKSITACDITKENTPIKVGDIIR